MIRVGNSRHIYRPLIGSLASWQEDHQNLLQYLDQIPQLKRLDEMIVLSFVNQQQVWVGTDVIGFAPEFLGLKQQDFFQGVSYQVTVSELWADWQSFLRWKESKATSLEQEQGALSVYSRLTLDRHQKPLVYTFYQRGFYSKD